MVTRCIGYAGTSTGMHKHNLVGKKRSMARPLVRSLK